MLNLKNQTLLPKTFAEALLISAANPNICFMADPADSEPAEGNTDTGDAPDRLYGDKDKGKDPADAPADDEPDAKDKPEEGKDADPEDDKQKADDDEPVAYKAEDYKIVLPEDLGLKDEKGEPLQFTEDDPFVAEAQELFAEGQVSPEIAEKFIGLYGKLMLDVQKGVELNEKDASEAAEKKITQELQKLEIVKEGGEKVSGPVRIENLLNSVDSLLGDGASKTLAPTLINSEIVVQLEALIEKATTGGTLTDGDTSKPGKSASQRLYGKK